MSEILAHQGGWDEVLYFAVPAVLAILAVRWAERRARRRTHDRETDPSGEPEKGQGPPEIRRH